MFTCILYVLRKTKQYKDSKIILETTSGKGSEICYRLEDFARFYNKFKNAKESIRSRIGICIDTCHIFSAGYDLRKKDKVKAYVEKLDKLIGLENITMLHFNDSDYEYNSRKDRHANIGKGYIGEEGLRYFLSFFKKHRTPILLETPNQGYKEEIRMIKGWMD